MNNCCIKIYLSEIPSDLPTHLFNSDGTLCFDLEPDFSETLVAEEFKSLKKIGNSAVREFDLPFTDKNQAIIYKYLSINSIYNQGAFFIPVIVMVGSRILSQDALILQDKIDSNKIYNATLSDSMQNWKTELKSCFLCDLDYPEFRWTRQNIIDNQTNETIYIDDNNVGYYFPLNYYGDWGYIDNITGQQGAAIRDFRPQFHLLPLLQKSFCKIGWNFECPILETQIGRRIGTYILGKFNETENAKAFSAKYHVRESYQFQPDLSGGVLPWDGQYLLTYEPDFDNGGNGGYGLIDESNRTVGFSGLSGSYCLRVVITVKSVDFVGVFQLQAFNTTTGQQDLSQQFTHVPDQSLTYEFVTEPLDMEPAHLINLIVFMPLTTTMFILDNTFIEVIPKQPGLAENIQINPAKLIKPELTSIDLLEGFAHLISGLFVTNQIDRTVKLLSPYTEDIFGEVVEKFYINGQRLIKDDGLVVCDSAKFNLKHNGRKRFYDLGYAKSEDDYIKSLGFNEDNLLYGARFDFGLNPNYEEDIESNLNPIFEPTLVASRPEITVGSVPIRIPIMVDNWDEDTETAEESFDIGPRLIIFSGLIVQRNGVSVSTQTNKQWYFEANIETEIAYASMIFGDYSLAYVSDFAEDWYKLAWQQKLSQLYNADQIEFLVLLNRCAFAFISFRELYQIEYKGQLIIGLLNSVNDFKACERISTPIEFETFNEIKNC